MPVAPTQGTGPGGLNLASLAQAATAETQTRVDKGQGALKAALAGMLREQQGRLQSDEDEQGRGHNFEAAQAQLDDALRRREAALEAASAHARMQFESEQGALQRSHLAREAAADRASENAIAAVRRNAEAAQGPDWFTQQRFQTDENIRQAKALAELDRMYRGEDERATAEADMPKLSDFGQDAVNPYRGQALMRQAKPSPGTSLLGRMIHSAIRAPLTKKEREDLSEIVATYGTTPVVVTEKAREYFKGNDERASAALWRLGWTPG